jgi:ATP-dependent DNA helicase RecG
LAGVAKPDYNYEFAGLMITFKTDIEEKTPGKGSPKSSPKSSPKTEMKVIELMMDKPEISAATIGEILGISKRAVLKHTKKLQEKGMLKRIGPARGGHWEITRKEND